LNRTAPPWSFFPRRRNSLPHVDGPRKMLGWKTPAEEIAEGVAIGT
jgi:hypothetical protein